MIHADTLNRLRELICLLDPITFSCHCDIIPPEGSNFNLNLEAALRHFVPCVENKMLRVSWLKCGCFLTSPTAQQFMLNISQLKRSEQWLYLAVFVAVFLHILPSWDLSPHWWWLTQIYSSPLFSSLLLLHIDSHRLQWSQSLGCLTQWALCAYVPLCNLSLRACPLFSTYSVLPLRTSPHPCSFPHPLLSCLIYPAASEARDWYLTG